MLIQNLQPRIHAARLTKDDISRAFPLVQLAVPRANQAQWRHFAHWYLSRPKEQGILAAWTPNRHIVGLVTFYRLPDLSQGDILVSDHLISADLFDNTAINTALRAALTEIAYLLGCSGHRTSLEELRDS
jgi:hypothetical protein